VNPFLLLEIPPSTIFLQNRLQLLNQPYLSPFLDPGERMKLNVAKQKLADVMKHIHDVVLQPMFNPTEATKAAAA
jgi:hypothetical protein